MTEMIKLTELGAMGRESSVYVNADKIIKYSREKWQDGTEKTLIEFGDASLFVKETPKEIGEHIGNLLYRRMVANAETKAAAHRKVCRPYPIGFVLWLPVLVTALTALALALR